jgi:RimJ/RimL family protein N-acetyltransferase
MKIKKIKEIITVKRGNIMCMIKGERVKISELKLDDVFQMQKWGKHSNPLFYDYNFPELTDEEVEEWYRIKKGKKNKKCFSIKNKSDKVIGYMTIKDIKRFKRQATLGIVFDPEYINKGYGTEAIKVFLSYYFNQMKMKSMKLQVAKFNKRAIRCYEKCGFIKTKEYKERLEDQSIRIFDDDIYTEIKDDFTIEKGIIYSYFYEMKVDKERFITLNKELSTEE